MLNRHAGEEGFRLTVDTGYDFTGFNSIVIREEAPDGTVTEHTASTDDAASGELYFVVPAGQFDTPGKYEFQAVIDMGGGKTLKSERGTVRFLTAL